LAARRGAAEAGRAAESEAMHESLQVAQTQSQDEQNHLSFTLEEVKRSNNEKDSRLKGFVDVIQDLMALVAGLQESHVQQTRDFDNLVGSIQQQQMAKEGIAQEAAHILTEHHHLAQQLVEQIGRVQDLYAGSEDLWHEERLRMKSQVLQLTQSNQSAAENSRTFRDELNCRNALNLVRRVKKLAHQKERANGNILREMIEALSGLPVVKVSIKGRRQCRYLKVRCGDFIRSSGLSRARNPGRQLPRLELMWGKAPFLRDSSAQGGSTVNLAEVNALGFGYSSCAPSLFPEVPPANCFSVYTQARSFDFVWHEEGHAEVFVLVLSRLCCRIQGWPVLGAISSRSKFLCARGWCKVEKACRHRSTLGKHLLDCLKELHADEHTHAGTWPEVVRDFSSLNSQHTLDSDGSQSCSGGNARSSSMGTG